MHREQLHNIKILRTADLKIKRNKYKNKVPKKGNSLWFTSCGYVRHAYVSGGNELQHFLHVFSAFLFVLWRCKDSLQHLTSCQTIKKIEQKEGTPEIPYNAVLYILSKDWNRLQRSSTNSSILMSCMWAINVCELNLFTYYLYQLHQHNPILQILPEVCDRLQAGFPPQLSVHPGDVRCQLLLQVINQMTKVQHTHI